ncbi:hypothetical protein TCAL_16856 [Tigriopus californicus]|uniref:Uncharacterized protein n=1 Tax=Tigriopus californicus TaxID=6832 RepID=A0A553PBR1_TIGCA|nr:hypothetical protein TCAL_16856 [Tigriopus californicus]
MDHPKALQDQISALMAGKLQAAYRMITERRKAESRFKDECQIVNNIHDKSLIMDKFDVWSFQEDGMFSANAFSSLNISLGHSRQDYSICLWIAVNYLRGSDSVFLSLGLEESIKALVGTYPGGQAPVEDYQKGTRAKGWYLHQRGQENRMPILISKIFEGLGGRSHQKALCRGCPSDCGWDGREGYPRWAVQMLKTINTKVVLEVKHVKEVTPIPKGGLLSDLDGSHDVAFLGPMARAITLKKMSPNSEMNGIPLQYMPSKGTRDRLNRLKKLEIQQSQSEKKSWSFGVPSDKSRVLEDGLLSAVEMSIQSPR